MRGPVYSFRVDAFTIGGRIGIVVNLFGNIKIIVSIRIYQLWCAVFLEDTFRVAMQGKSTSAEEQCTDNTDTEQEKRG